MRARACVRERENFLFNSSSRDISVPCVCVRERERENDVCAVSLGVKKFIASWGDVYGRTQNGFNGSLVKDLECRL